MKKALSLILAVVLLMTVGIPTLADDRPENHWYWDSGGVIELGNESTASTKEEIGDLDDYFTLHTPSPITNIVWSVDESYAFAYNDSFQSFSTGTGYETDIQFSKLLPDEYQSWSDFFENAPCQGTDSKGNKLYQATLTVTLENNASKNIDLSFWFAKILTMNPDFESNLKDGAISKEGNKLTIEIIDPLPDSDQSGNYTFEWAITKGQDYAGFTPTKEPGSDKTTSTTYTNGTGEGHYVHEMTVYGYKAGMVTIECHISAKNDTDPDHKSWCRVVGIPVCIEKATADDIRDELDEIQSGNDTVIELPPEKGLDKDLLEKIKESAEQGTGNPVVTLKPESQNNPMDLSFEFNAKDVNTTIENPFNMYYEATEDAQTGSKWLTFAYSGEAPATNMKIRFKAPGNLKSYTMSFVNEDTGELTESQTATVDEDSYLTYYIKHFSTYVVYPADNTPPSTKPQPSGGGGGGGSSGGGSSSHSTPLLRGSVLKDVTSSTATAKTVGTAEAASAASKAAAQAKSAGKATGSVRFVNSPALPKAALDAVQKAAAENGVPLTVYADTVANNAVTARLYVNPANATLPDGIKTGVTIGDTAVENHFHKYFSNPLKCVRFAQQGTFGMDVGVAVKVDLNGMDPSKLVLYSYDVASNTYTALPNQAYYVDLSGYLHFTTSVGGSLIISQGPLA